MGSSTLDRSRSTLVDLFGLPYPYRQSGRLHEHGEDSFYG